MTGDRDRWEVALYLLVVLVAFFGVVFLVIGTVHGLHSVTVTCPPPTP